MGVTFVTPLFKSYIYFLFKKKVQTMSLIESIVQPLIDNLMSSTFKKQLNTVAKMLDLTIEFTEDKNSHIITLYKPILYLFKKKVLSISIDKLSFRVLSKGFIQTTVKNFSTQTTQQKSFKKNDIVSLYKFIIQSIKL